MWQWMKAWVSKLRKHEHTYIMRQAYKVNFPTGSRPAYTSIVVMRCSGCKGVSLFSYANWKLLDEEDRNDFIAELDAQGLHILPEEESTPPMATIK